MSDIIDENLAPQKYRTIWISDVHLGTIGCRADLLLDFLRDTESEKLYLVGDMIDGWRLKQRWFWPQAHNDVVQKILRKARKGTEVIYIPGNHDEFLRDFLEFEMNAGNIELKLQDIHITVDGKRLLVIHGDEFDGVVRYGKWLAMLGSWAYDMTIILNRWFNIARRRLGLPYWSLSAFLKRRVKEAVKFITNFENALVEEARRQETAGVVCGHIHHAQMKCIDGLLYLNDGDWVESCTALVEHFDGSLEIIYWAAPAGNEPVSADRKPKEERKTPDEICTWEEGLNIRQS